MNKDDSESDSEIELQIHLQDEKKIEEKVQRELIKYDEREVYLLFKRFKRLHRDAGRLLNQSKFSFRVSITFKMIIVIFSLITSYISALSPISDTTKTYVITFFSLGSALLSGLTSVKSFSKDASKFYTGYTEYLELATSIEPIFYNFTGYIPYSDLVVGIDKVITKYEGMIYKTEKQSLDHATKRPKVFENLIYNKIKKNNNGKLPEWLEKQIEVEINNDIDIRRVIAEEEHLKMNDNQDKKKEDGCC
jgi:hypothetical protein